MSTGGLRRREPDPWSGRSGYTTLNKDSKVVWEPGLPAQCISRRHHAPRNAADAADERLTCDLKTTLKLSADAKADWLPRALKGIQQKQAKAQDVYDIVTHPRFVSGVGNRVGQRMLRSVTDSIHVFSEKQRDSFSKSKLFQEFAVQSQLKPQDDSSDDEAKGSGARSQSRGRSSSSSAPAGGDAKAEKRPSVGDPKGERRRRSHSREKDKRQDSKAPAAPGSSAPPLPAGEVHGSSRRSDREEKARIERAFRDQENKREDDRRAAEAQKQSMQDRENARKAKLGSAFLVDDEEEDDDQPEMHQAMVRRAEEKRHEERVGANNSMIEYSAAASSRGQPSNEPQEAGRFVESMGGGSILHEAQRLLLQKAGGEMRSPSVVRRDRNKPVRSRSRRRRRSRSRSRSRSLPNTRSGGVRSSGSYRSPTPCGRARGQARAARKAKMIASMLGVQMPGRR